MNDRPSFPQRSTTIACIAALCAMVTSCAPTPAANPTPTPTPAATSSSQISDQLWEQVAAKYPDAERPSVTMVRYVDRFEWAGVIADCMAESGFEAEAQPNGMLAVNQDDAQGMASDVAQWSCMVRYPLEEKYTRPFDDAQLKALYEYQTTTLTSCLQEAGVEVSAAPSLEVFEQTWQTAEQWSPYLDVADSGLLMDQIYELATTCPELPEHVYDLG
ncbi:hypothetical protein ACEYYH_12255 [Microbacterium trichothecenolyticum]|uniref:hypothetical protein n=1 Tax=Microbacterium trichothecenolyticum TaxID=69370 RepID=UPI0035BE911F